MLTPFEKALTAHLIADWLLQNDWMALHKVSLRHPAAWVHGAIHAVLLSLVLGWEAGMVLGALHVLIDTRRLLYWWARRFGKTQQGLIGAQVMIWCDQVLHISCLAAWIAWFG